MNGELGAARRSTLAGLADQLIPEADGMPSASQARATGRWLDEVLRVRPDMLAPLETLLDRAAGEEPAAATRRLQESDPDAFSVLTEAVAGAYFLNPDVRRALGYPGQQAVPIDVEGPPDYEQDGLLASVISRGPIYRPTPGTEER